MTHPLLEHLPADCREAFERHVVLKDYARGEVIFHQGAKTLGLYFVDSGMVQFQIDNTSGKSTFIGIAKTDTYLGDCELLAQLRHFTVATAFTDCRIGLLPKQYFEKAMAEFPHFATAVATRLAKNLHLLQMVLMVRHQWSVEQNLVGILSYLATHFGTELPEGGYRINIALSQDQLADMAGLTRQSIHKPLQTWKALGWIDYHYGNMVIHNMEALIEIMGNNSQRQLQSHESPMSKT